MKTSFRLLPAVMAVCTATAWGQPNQREPHIGYLYPAGGQRGSTFTVFFPAGGAPARVERREAAPAAAVPALLRPGRIRRPLVDPVRGERHPVGGGGSPFRAC